MSTFSVTVRVERTVPVISVAGFFDADTGRQAEVEMTRAAAAAGGHMVLDLGGVTSISDPGYAALRDLAAQITGDRQLQLIVVCRDKTQRRGVEKAGVLDAARPAATVEEALGLLGL